MIPQSAFARYLGVGPMVVSRGVRDGKLSKCVIRDEKGRPLGLTSILDAAEEWKANSDYTDAPQRYPEVLKNPPPQIVAPPEPKPAPAAVSEPKPAKSDSIYIEQNNNSAPAPNLAEAAALAKHYDAQLKKLKLEAAQRLLIPRAEVEAGLVDYISACKTKLLAIPSRVKQADPSLTLKQVELIEGLVREALEELTPAEESEQ